MNKRKLHGLPVQEEPAALKPQPPGPLAPIGKPEPIGFPTRMHDILNIGALHMLGTKSCAYAVLTNEISKKEISLQ